jgi:hypothetical protein
MKAVIATDVIFVIALIALIVTTALIIFWKWVASENAQAGDLSCRMKQYSYCIEWKNAGYGANAPKSWEELPPKQGCENFNIAQPSMDECKNLLK